MITLHENRELIASDRFEFKPMHPTLSTNSIETSFSERLVRNTAVSRLSYKRGKAYANVKSYYG